MIFLWKMFPFWQKHLKSYQTWPLDRTYFVLTCYLTAQSYPRWCFATLEEYSCIRLTYAALFDMRLWRYVCFVADAVTAWRIAPTRMMKWWIRSYVTIVGKQVILWLTAPIHYKMVFCLWPYLIVSPFFFHSVDNLFSFPPFLGAYISSGFELFLVFSLLIPILVHHFPCTLCINLAMHSMEVLSIE